MTRLSQPPLNFLSTRSHQNWPEFFYVPEVIKGFVLKKNYGGSTLACHPVGGQNAGSKTVQEDEDVS